MTTVMEERQMAAETGPILPQVRENIRAVYPVGKDAWEGGIGEGLAFLRELLAMYEQADIPLSEVHISTIYHGPALYMVLKDEAFKKIGKKRKGNPNKEIIRELWDKGVSIEICSLSMKRHKIKEEDLLPEVSVVQSTFTRVIDLEMQGYAFIEF